MTSTYTTQQPEAPEADADAPATPGVPATPDVAVEPPASGFRRDAWSGDDMEEARSTL